MTTPPTELHELPNACYDRDNVSQGRALVAVAAELQQQVIEALDGWTLHAFPDGESAIDHLWEGSPDLIVLDFDLPRMTAYDVVRHLSMRRPELLPRTVVLIDGNDNARALIEGVTIRHCIDKSADHSDTVSALRAHLTAVREG